jgi:hypothetical protein
VIHGNLGCRFSKEVAMLVRYVLLAGLVFTASAGEATASVAVVQSGSAIAKATVDKPSISGFSPARGTPGTKVKITGKHLTGASAVAVAGVKMLFSVVSASTVTATVPVGARPGKITITTKAGTAVSTKSFVVTPAAGTGIVRVTLSAPTHQPKVNVPWPLTVTVTDTNGRPHAATLTVVVLFGGAQVGKIDNGAVYHFVGSWREKKGNEITWPAASRGQPLTLQVIVKAQGMTVRKNWAITVT